MCSILLHINDSGGLQLAVAGMQEAQNRLPPSFYSAQEQQEFEQLKSSKRRRERATTLWLLHDFWGVKNALHHHHDGRPYLAGSAAHISISHTRQHVALALHPAQKAGVDVENTRRNFARTATRFLSEDEQRHLPTPLQQCLAWCAKETVYKLACEQGVDFAEHIALEKFDGESEGEILAHFSGKAPRSYTLRYHVVKGLAVVYGVG